MKPVLSPLRISDRLVTSPFGLLGADENGLTFALGYTFQRYPRLLRWFLARIGVQGLRVSALRHAAIHLQRHRSKELGQGITDIEVHLPGYFHVIVEAKVGLAVPTIDQCRKYLPRFREADEPQQKLVALVQAEDGGFVCRYGEKYPSLRQRLVCFTWPELYTECVRLLNSNSADPAGREWIEALYQFLDQDYQMKAFTTEVWILPVDTKPLWKNGLSFWDMHQKYQLYFDRTHPNVRPLYLGFRVNGSMDAIYRLDRIEHGRPIVEAVPELVNLKKAWPKLPYTIWHFGPAIPLPNPLRTGAGMYNRRVRCDLDLLLTCSTVQEVEQVMSERRQAAN